MTGTLHRHLEIFWEVNIHQQCAKVFSKTYNGVLVVFKMVLRCYDGVWDMKSTMKGRVGLVETAFKRFPFLVIISTFSKCFKLTVVKPSSCCNKQLIFEIFPLASNSLAHRFLIWCAWQVDICDFFFWTISIQKFKNSTVPRSNFCFVVQSTKAWVAHHACCRCFLQCKLWCIYLGPI